MMCFTTGAFQIPIKEDSTLDVGRARDGYHGHLPFLPFEFEVWEVSMSIVASTQVETSLVATNLSGLLNHFFWHQPPRTKRHLVLPTMSWFEQLTKQMNGIYYLTENIESSYHCNCTNSYHFFVTTNQQAETKYGDMMVMMMQWIGRFNLSKYLIFCGQN